MAYCSLHVHTEKLNLHLLSAEVARVIRANTDIRIDSGAQDIQAAAPASTGVPNGSLLAGQGTILDIWRNREDGTAVHVVLRSGQVSDSLWR